MKPPYLVMVAVLLAGASAFASAQAYPSRPIRMVVPHPAGGGGDLLARPLPQRCFDAVGSKHKTMKVFTRAEGGYHHCQIDNVSVGVAYMWDWLETVLEPGS